MKSRAAPLLLALACGLGMTAAFGLEYRSIGSEPAILYDAPTLRGQKVFVAPRGMPLEVVLAQGDWLRVRDAAGDLAWVEKKALGERRNVVSLATATVRASPAAAASAVFQVQKGVLLEIVEPVSAGWVRVRHADGSAGYVSAAEVWGE